MPRICGLLTILLVTTAMAASVEPPADPATINTLVTQLGDPDFHVRQQAEHSLDDIGKAALPAVQQASHSVDPEVRARAERLSRRIDRRPVPGTALDPNGTITGTNLDVTIDNETKIVVVDEGNRHIRYVEDGHGIHLEVKATVDGKDVSEIYEAPTVGDLMLENPEAGEICERWCGGEGPHYNLGSIHLNTAGHQKLPHILRRQSDKHLSAIREQLSGAMDLRHTPPLKRKMVNDLIDQLMHTLLVENGQPSNIEIPEGGVSELSEQLRQLTKDLGLPEPQGLPVGGPPQVAGGGGGGLLIRRGFQLIPQAQGLPPGVERLGVQVQPLAGGGLFVRSIIPGSRAEKMGVQPGDQIQKLQGEPVASPADVLRIIAGTVKPLVIEGVRGGAELRLEEKAAEKQP